MPMNALTELHHAVQNQRFATGNDDLLLGRAIMELVERVEALEAKNAVLMGMAEQKDNEEAPVEQDDAEEAAPSEDG